jgi:exopolyphosphatase/guanosine-5'-triphosphate,3'-diphosphate pyrophosphatase
MTGIEGGKLRVAALDLGSLTVRLIVAECRGPGRFRVLFRRREITRLGEDLARTGLLSPEARARTLAALKAFTAEMAAAGVQQSAAVATQALRQAKNGEIFLAQIRESLGLKVRLITPREEARLSLDGVLSVLDTDLLKSGPVLVFDVGGGSTEWALVRPGQDNLFASLPLGVLTLSQAHPLGDPPRPEAVARLKKGLKNTLSNFFKTNFPGLAAASPRLVGTAGALTTLAAMCLKMSAYDPNLVNNMVMTRFQVEELADLMIRLPEAQRALLPGLEPAKAGVMVAGGLTVLAILEFFRQDSLTVTDAGLLEGVLGEVFSY